MENVSIKQQIDILYEKLVKSAATFIYNPNEIKEIQKNIFELQKECLHEYENGKCIYCRKEQGNVNEEKRYL